MGKAKPGGIPNRQAYSRLSYLYQAAAHLATTSAEAGAVAAAGARSGETFVVGMSRRLLADLRAVSQKTQIRLSPELKRTVCRFCDSLLVEGRSCSTSIENPSRRAAKPWAAVLVCQCHTCGRVRRSPVCAPRQVRRHLRPLVVEGGGTAAPEASAAAEVQPN